MGNDKILSDDDKVAKTLNNFFSNIVKNLDISENKIDDIFLQNIRNHPTLKAILKYRQYRKHLSDIPLSQFSHQMKSFDKKCSIERDQ